LYFLKRYDNVVMPDRIRLQTKNPTSSGSCEFPRDGGDAIRNLQIGPVPWRF